MEGVISRHFTLSELLFTFPLVHPFYHPSSSHISILLEAPTEALACVVGSSTVLHGEDSVSSSDPHCMCWRRQGRYGAYLGMGATRNCPHGNPAVMVGKG